MTSYHTHTHTHTHTYTHTYTHTHLQTRTHRTTEIDRILATRVSTDKIVISFQHDLRASLAKEIALDLLEVNGVTVYSARTTSTLARQYGVQRPDTIVLVERYKRRLMCGLTEGRK